MSRRGRPFWWRRRCPCIRREIRRCPESSGLPVTKRDGPDDSEKLRESHELAWRHLWNRCDMELGADARTRMMLRLHLFHLLQVNAPRSADLDAGIPARGWLWQGAYRGHIFWDELFILPFLNLRFPGVARSRLLYRFRRLGSARRAAAV